MTTKIVKSISLSDAAHQLDELIRLAYEGAEIILTDAGTPLARLVPAVPLDQPRIAGLNAGEAWMSEDFNAELPDEFWLGQE